MNERMAHENKVKVLERMLEEKNDLIGDLQRNILKNKVPEGTSFEDERTPIHNHNTNSCNNSFTR